MSKPKPGKRIRRLIMFSAYDAEELIEAINNFVDEKQVTIINYSIERLSSKLEAVVFYEE